MRASKNTALPKTYPEIDRYYIRFNSRGSSFGGSGTMGVPVTQERLSHRREVDEYRRCPRR